MFRSRKDITKMHQASFIAWSVVAAVLCFQVSAYAGAPGISREAIDLLSRESHARAEVAAAVKPSVVNVSTTKTVKSGQMVNPFLNDPFFRQFFGNGPLGHPKEYKQASLGSGVIVDANGYILTNYHVIKDADQIKIKLSDNREFNGKVIGTDPKTDLAVIKIDAANLPALKWGDSDKLEVGDTVLAIGNPYGLNQTVTSGIVSATGRANLRIADYEDFIQTDAPINPGNSGGALVNVRGELVGINTAIFSTSGGYQGIGFAIPGSMAKVVMSGLIRNGKIVRGWLGVSVQPVTTELASQFGLKNEKGALVADTVENSPAEKAGIQRGDVIIKYDGKEVDDPVSLRNMVAATPTNKEVAMELIRAGEVLTVKALILEIPAQMQKPMQSSFESFNNVLKGVHVQDITAALRSELNIPERITGVIVSDVEGGSPAGNSLARNDVILELNRKKIENSREYEAMASKVTRDQSVLLLVYRNGMTIYVALSAK